MDPFLSVYGHVTLDQILTVGRFPRDNTTEDVLSKASSLGGTGANIAVAAARLGCPTALCSLIGRDLPEQYRDLMADSGVILDEMVEVDGYETSTCIIANDPSLTQKVLFYQGPQGYGSAIGIDLESNAKRSSHVHFCTGDPEWYIGIMGDLEKPSKALDPAQESHRIWNADRFGRALPLADALFCNNYEAESLRSYIGKDDILDADVPIVVCTEGAEGSRARIGDDVLRIPAVAPDRVVDPTGCGDSYRAGYYAALYRGYDAPEALVVASSVASFVLQETGALSGTPTWEQAIARAEPWFGEIHRSCRLVLFIIVFHNHRAWFCMLSRAPRAPGRPPYPRSSGVAAWRSWTGRSSSGRTGCSESTMRTGTPTRSTWRRSTPLSTDSDRWSTPSCWTAISPISWTPEGSSS